jgi:hypothetical protein
MSSILILIGIPVLFCILLYIFSDFGKAAQDVPAVVDDTPVNVEELLCVEPERAAELVPQIAILEKLLELDSLSGALLNRLDGTSLGLARLTRHVNKLEEKIRVQHEQINKLKRRK